MGLSKILDKIAKLEKRSWLRFGYLKEVDYDGTAKWNPDGYIPAALVVIYDKGENGEVPLPPCRIQAIGATADCGIWWPPTPGEIVAVSCLDTWDAPVVLNSKWTGNAAPPEEANEHRVVLKWKGHVFQMDATEGEAGITMKTAGGNNVYLYDGDGKPQILIEHPSGTYVKIDSDGNYEVYSTGNNTHTALKDFIVNATGEIDMSAGSNASFSAGGQVDIEGTSINLRVFGALMGVLTQATHPTCRINGSPIIGHPLIKGG